MKKTLLLSTLLLVAMPSTASTQGPSVAACRPLVNAPGFRGSDGSTTSLSALSPGRPLAVVVIKGYWCPACTDQLASLSKRIDAIRKMGADVVGISTEDPGTNRKIIKDHNLRLEILSEPSARLLERLGFWMPRMGHPLPGVIFLNGCGDVHSAIPGRRPGRLQDKIILDTLRKLTRAGCGQKV